MYSKLCIPVVAALAVVVQAGTDASKHTYHHGYDHHHHHFPSGIFPSGLPFKPSGSAPFPTGVPTGGIFPTGTASGSGISGGSGPQQTGGPTTLTYTLGSGDHTTVVTTTIYHTNTHTDVSRLLKENL